jgi:hypothetical protein
MTLSSQPGNNKKTTETKSKSLSGTETQTEPIMVPFPLPPIGKPVVAAERVTIAIQSDYTWMFNEFPVRTTQNLATETPIVSTPIEGPLPVLPLRSSPKKSSKKAASPKPEITTVPVDKSAEESSEPESVPEMQDTPPSPAPVVESLKPAKTTKKQKTVAPPSPVNEPLVETPIPIKKKPSMIEPVISDSSDDETAEVVRSLLAPKPVKLSRVITPIQVKPSAESPSEPTKQKKTTPVRAPPSTPASSSEEEVESPKKPVDESSSSESDADIPSVGTVLATPTQSTPSHSSSKKKKSPNSPPATPTRFGPLVQVENVSPDHVEYIKSKMLEKIPENMRSGSIKSGVHDPDTNRLIVQLRTHPRVAHFMSVDNGILEINSQGETRNMTILSDGQKRKVIGLFSEEPLSSPPSAKRSK